MVKQEYSLAIMLRPCDVLDWVEERETWWRGEKVVFFFSFQKKKFDFSLVTTFLQYGTSTLFW